MKGKLYLFFLCTYQLLVRTMLDTRMFLFVLVLCVLSTTLLIKLGMHETLLQVANSYKQHNSTERDARNIARKDINTSISMTSEIRLKEAYARNISREDINTNLSITGGIHLKEADARNISRTIISLQESFLTKCAYQWFGPKQNCNHQKITDYFLKQFLKLNDNLSQINNVVNIGGGQRGYRNENTKKIGILIPSITRKVNCTQLLQFTLFEKCLPSILNSISGNFLYKIYIGFDKNDVYFSALNNLTKSHVYIESISLAEVECQTFVAAVNTIAKKAFEEGMDYFVRINDDTVFTTSNWSILAIEVLRNYTPPNVGVAGPTCKEGNTGILTHDMVHRSHLEIFLYYYPPVFENWWADDWITQVYKPNRFTKLETWTVQHLLQDTRYAVDWSILWKLDKTVREGKIKLNAYGPVFKHLNISAVH